MTMNHPLLVNKLTMPNLNQVVHRQTLVKQLHDASDYPLIVIQAAAGFGKTHLIYDWLSHSDQHVCWLTLDEMNDVPSEFWQYICASFNGLSPKVTQAVQPLLDNRYIEDVTPICDGIITALHAFTRSRNRPNHCVLVLDDFHHIKNKKILASLARLIDHKPYWLQVVISSRTLPDLSIPSRLSKKSVFLITSAQLNYTVEECKDVLNVHPERPRSDEEIHHIFNISQGWPAVVQLLAISQSASSLTPNSINANNQDYVSEFLMEEIYSSINPNIKRILNIACILPHFNLNIIQGISAEPIEPDVFDELTTSGLIMYVNATHNADFITVKMHELFRTWLEHNLNQSDPELIFSLRKNAMYWLIDKKQYEDAFSLAATIKDWSNASLILGYMIEDQVNVSRLDYLNFLLEKIPQSYIESLPKLSLLKAMIAFSQYKKRALNHYIICAKTSLNRLKIQEEDNHSSLLLELGIHDDRDLNIVTGTLVVFEDLISLFDGHKHNIKSISPDFNLDGSHPMQAWWMHLKFVYSFMHEDLNNALELGQEALRIARTQNNILCSISTASWLSHCLYQTGKTEQAMALLLDLKKWLTHIGALNVPNIFSLYASLGYLYIEALDYQRAQGMLELAEKTVTEFSEPREVMFNLYHFKFKLLMSQDKQEDALLCIKQMHEYEANNIHNQSASEAYSAMPDTHILECLHALKTKNAQPIILWAMQYQDADDALPIKQSFENFIKVIGLTLSGQDLSEELCELIEQARSSNNHARRLSLELFQCAVHYGQGQREIAGTLLLGLLEQATAFGYRQLILDGGPSIEPLLESLETLTHLPKPIRSLRHELLNSIHKVTDPFEPEIPSIHSPSQLDEQAQNKRKQFDTLTNRESEVLAQLALGLRNQDIARALNISLATVKRHIQNIYSKLHINSRTEAALLFNHLSV